MPAGNKRQLLIVFIISSSFFFLYSFYSIYKYMTLNATGFDLGIYAASLHGYLNGNFFYSRLLNGSFFGSHFSPFMYVVAFFFWIFPHNATLLVIQAFMVTFTAIPLYLIFQKISAGRVDNVKAILLILCYETSIYSIGPLAFDFHMMALLPFFYSWALYYFISGKPVRESVAIAFMISLHASFVIIFLLYLLVTRSYKYCKRGMIARVRAKPGKAMMLSFFYAAVVIGIIGYFLTATKIRDFYGNTPYGDINSIHAFLNYLFIRYRITYSFQSLLSNYHPKLSLVSIAVVSGGFYALFSPVFLIPAIPYVLFSFFSANGAYISIGDQYTAMLSPIVFTSAFIGLARSRSKHAGKRILNNRIVKKTGSMIMIAAIVIGVLSGFFYPGTIFNSEPRLPAIENFHYNDTAKAIFEIRGNISTNACLLTQNNVYPEFDGFPNAYLLYSYTSVGNLSNLYSRNFTYIIADTYSSYYYQVDVVGTSMQNFIVRAQDSGEYSTYYDNHGIIVLKRNP